MAGRRDVTDVEDLSQAGLGLDSAEQPVPLVAEDDRVVAIGSLSQTFWAGLSIGWLRIPRSTGLRLMSDTAPSAPAQLLAVRLLQAADPAWYAELRRTLRQRRDLLLDLLARHLPAWRRHVPHAGLSLWAALPASESETYAHLAATHHGVHTTPGTTFCVDRHHLSGLRLSFAQSPRTLETAVDRLTVAWEEHTRQLAAGLG